MDYLPTLTPDTNVTNVTAPTSWLHSTVDGVTTVSGNVNIEPIHKKDDTHTGMTSFYATFPLGLTADSLQGFGVSLEGDQLILSPESPELDPIESPNVYTALIRFDVCCHQSQDTKFTFTFSFPT